MRQLALGEGYKILYSEKVVFTRTSLYSFFDAIALSSIIAAYIKPIETCYNKKMKTKAEQTHLEPEQLHKRQTMLQVLLPVLIMGVVCLGLCLTLIFVTSSEPQGTEQWAQISTMFLILPAIFLGLVLLALLVFLGIMGGKWNKSWPPALRNVRLVIIHFENIIQGLAQKPAQPIIGIKSAVAGFRAIFKK